MSLENLSGQTLGQYELRELLGVGGMGAVYRAYQPSLRREVAVKVLPPALIAQSDDTARFNREAEVAATLEHPHIVPIVDHGTVRGTSYIVMRLLTGGTLADRLIARRGSPPSLGEINEILKQLAGALAYAHNRNVIHRDLKPTNVMFDDSGNAYLVDFGIAKILDASVAYTIQGMVMGTPTYMAPEQWRGRELSHATDQYALAGMIYQLITGQPPFEAPTRDSLMYKHLEETPIPAHIIREGIPEQITDVLLRAMAKDEKQRYGSITAFAQAFEAAIAGHAGEPTQFLTFRLPPRATKGVRTPSRPSPIARSTGSSTVELVKRNPLIAGVAALIVLLVALAIFLLGQASTPPATIVAALPSDTATSAPSPQIITVLDTDTPVAVLAITDEPSLTPDTDATLAALVALTRTAAFVTTEAALPSVTPTATQDIAATLDAIGTATEVAEQARAAAEAAVAATLASPIPTLTETATNTATATETPLPEASATPVPVIRMLDTDTPTPEPTATETTTVTPEPTRTALPTFTFTPAPTATPTVDMVAVAQTLSGEQTALAFIEQETQTASARDATATATLWTATPSATWTPSQSPTMTPTVTASPSATPTLTVTPSATWTPSQTSTLTPSPSATPSPTVTPSSTAPPSPTPTAPPASLPAAQPTLEVRTVRSVEIIGDTRVNLRSGPSTGSSRVTTAASGDRFVVEEVQSGPDSANTWYRVRLEDSRNAWVRGDLVRFEERVNWTPVERDFDGVTMVLVPAGCFSMGGTQNTREQPVHEQCFDQSFWMDKYEVPQAQFRRLGGRQATAPRFSGDDRPVENITWFEAHDFCTLRGGRLPTEAEWEYAARGPTGWLYPWGDTWNGNNAVWNRSGSQGTVNVGSIAAGASWVGALDMSGNVWEWTSSLYEPYPYDAQDGRERDTGSDTSIRRVLRGGSWFSINSILLRAPNRFRNIPGGRYDDLGFRCARDYDSVVAAVSNAPPTATWTSSPTIPPTPSATPSSTPTARPASLPEVLVEVAMDGSYGSYLGYAFPTAWTQTVGNDFQRYDLEGNALVVFGSTSVRNVVPNLDELEPNALLGFFMERSGYETADLVTLFPTDFPGALARVNVDLPRRNQTGRAYLKQLSNGDKVVFVALGEGALEPAVNDAAKALGASLAYRPTLSEVAAGNADLSTLVAAVGASGLGSTLDAGNLTVFAPTNEAFAAALDALGVSAEALLGSGDLLTTILTYHAVPGQVFSTDLAAGEVATVQGDPVTINLSAGVQVNQANVVAADVVARDAVVHVIDAVLLPPSLCIVSPKGGTSTTVRVGPGNNRTAVAFLAIDDMFVVISQAEVDDTIWYRLLSTTKAAPGKLIDQAWVSSAEVSTSGVCNMVPLDPSQ